jgi:hypothetical protein
MLGPAARRCPQVSIDEVAGISSHAPVQQAQRQVQRQGCLLQGHRREGAEKKAAYACKVKVRTILC